MQWAARNNGLPSGPSHHTIPLVLALNPNISSTLYTALWDGRLFRTVDGGLVWEEKTNGLSLSASENWHNTLAINPSAPNVLLYSYWEAPAPVYRSVDGGESWSPVDVGPEDYDLITDLAFSPQVSGTVYGSRMGDTLLAISEDGGATWIPFGTRTGDWMLSLGLDPSSGLPAYLGAGASGTWQSDDGGQTWSLSTDGITGLPIEHIAAAPSRPERVYVAAEGAGGFGSDDAGASWRELDLWKPEAFAVAVALQQPNIAYIGAYQGVYRSFDGGATWEKIGMPVSYSAFINSVAVSPISSAVVFAGGRDGDASQVGQKLGVVFRSVDYGATWTELNIGRPISMVSSIAFDPVDDQIVYLATGRGSSPTDSGPGLGVFRSLDQGDTWQPIVNGMGQVPALGLAIHPDDPQIIYAAAWLFGESKMFRSVNRGDLWTPIDFPGIWGHWGSDIVIDPLAPNVLYASGYDGLFRSCDSGMSWTRAAGTLGQVSIYGLSIASANERTIVYVGTTGGLPSSGVDSAFTLSTDDEFVAAGVYQQTISHRPLDNHIYLALVLRQE